MDILWQHKQMQHRSHLLQKRGPHQMRTSSTQQLQHRLPWMHNTPHLPKATLQWEQAQAQQQQEQLKVPL